MTTPDLDRFLKFYEGKRIPDPEHFPKSFEYYVKLWRYKDEQDIRSNAIVPREPGECTTGAE